MFARGHRWSLAQLVTIPFSRHGRGLERAQPPARAHGVSALRAVRRLRARRRPTGYSPSATRSTGSTRSCGPAVASTPSSSPRACTGGASPTRRPTRASSRAGRSTIVVVDPRYSKFQTNEQQLLDDMAWGGSACVDGVVGATGRHDHRVPGVPRVDGAVRAEATRARRSSWPRRDCSTESTNSCDAVLEAVTPELAATRRPARLWLRGCGPSCRAPCRR